VKTEGGLEVDFHAWFPGRGEELIQVCADPSVEPTREREVRALAEAGREHPRARRRLLVRTVDHVFDVPGVEVEPAWKWLLSAPG
jgi:predicted AAA+ superfamily ATPase